MKYTFTIKGNPTPLARARIRPNYIFSSTKKKMWDSQKELKLITAISIRNQFEDQGITTDLTKLKNDVVFDSPLGLDVVFYMPIPKSSKKKLNLYEGKFHYKRPDLDNLLKFVCDVCMGVLYKDDSVIVSVTAKKVYSDNARTVFTLKEV